MFNFKKATLEEFWKFVAAHLESKGIGTTLVGGAVATIYSNGAYESGDLDFVFDKLFQDRGEFEEALKQIGIKRIDQRNFKHPDCIFFLEAKSPPIAIGEYGPKESKENLNYYVSKILLGKNISSLVAKKDVSFSNSMVERFFNTLKNRYLDKTKRTKFSRLYGKIERSVVTFNNTPHSKLQGATPNEVFYGNVSMEGLALEFKRKKKEWAKLRPEINQFCKVGKKQPCCD